MFAGFGVGVAVLIGISIPGNSAHAPKLVVDNDVRYIVQTNLRDPYEMGKLSRSLVEQGFDVAGIVRHRGEIEVITNIAGVARLNENGLYGNQSLTVLAPDSRYLNPTTVAMKLQRLHAAYPELTRLEQIGTSNQGRPIFALLVSNTPLKNDPAGLKKPSIIFDGVHHAREVMTAEVVMDVAEELLTKQSSNGVYKSILQNWMVWVVPMLNVDGSNIVFTESSMWRKNARESNGRIYGVDLNRNYMFNWNRCGGSSGSMGSDSYRGPTAASEPETRAIMNLAEMVRPTASLSYHSYGEMVLYSYGCSGVSASEKALVEKIGKEIAAQLPEDSGGGTYAAGTPWELLYGVDGDSMDHIYSQFGSLSYAFEINQDFQPSYSIRQATLEKHRKAWSWYLMRMTGSLLSVTTVNGKTGVAESSEVEIDKVIHRNGELPFKSNSAGVFFKVLDPGTYVITGQTADGRRGSLSIEMDGQPKSVTLVVQ